MICVYGKLYLNSVLHNIGGVFDIAVNAENINADDFARLFVGSAVAREIEAASPDYLVGKSSTELLSIIVGRQSEFSVIPSERSPEYWGGWILAYAQWSLRKTFREIISAMPFSQIVALYNPYHEADDDKAVDVIRKFFSAESPLKRIRLTRKLSQTQLSELSGVKLRSIQVYEQGGVDIKKAQGETLYALASALDCTIEDLLDY